MAIAVLIGTMIAILVGVNLIPVIEEAATKAAAEPGITPAVATLLDVLPIVFVAVILLGAVAWIGNEGGLSIPWFHRKRLANAPSNSKDLRDAVEAASLRLFHYFNNLDACLGITTKRADNAYLKLVGNVLYIPKPTEAGGDFDWFLTAKHPTEPAFKVVGLHSNDPDQNVTYTLGTGKKGPYLVKDENVSLSLTRLDYVEHPNYPEVGIEADVAKALAGVVAGVVASNLIDSIEKENDKPS